MAQTEEKYLSMGRKTRIDLALSLDIHRSYGMAEVLKFIFDAKNNLNGKANKKALYDQIDATTLDINKNSYPFLRKFLNRILMNEKWIANHIASLTFVMLWDILSEEQPTIKDLYSLKFEQLPMGFRIQPRETRRILNEYYNYMHYHPVKWPHAIEKLADNPNNIIISPIGPRRTRPLAEEKKSLKTIATPLTMDKALNPEIHLEDFADPYYLKRLFAYRQLVLKMIETIKERTLKRKTKTRKEYDWLIQELVHSDYALTILFQNASREVEKRWFRDLNANSRFSIIALGREGYSQSEVALTISAYKNMLNNYNDKEYHPFEIFPLKTLSNILEQITLAALDLANRGIIDVPKWLFLNLFESFKIEGKDKATVEHNLGIFEMLNKDYGSASRHFQSAIEYWKSEKYRLLEDIDSWNLTLANEKLGQTGVWKQKTFLIDSLGKKQAPFELSLFLIRQIADISGLFGNRSGERHWLEIGISKSANLKEFCELALYFEARLGSLNILGSTNEQKKCILEKIQLMRESYCKTLGDTENFMVFIDKKFYLLREEFMKSSKKTFQK